MIKNTRIGSTRIDRSIYSPSRRDKFLPPALLPNQPTELTPYVHHHTLRTVHFSSSFHTVHEALFYPLISSHNAWMASYGRVVKWINDLVFKNSIWSHIYSSFISQNARMKSIRGCCIGWYSELLKQRFAVIIISVAGFYSWSPSRSNCSDCHHKRISSAQSICNLVFFFLYSIL